MSDGYGTAAERYKDLSALYDGLSPFDEEAAATVAFLAELAHGGRVLELAVGTGRIAIPLAEHGCDVTGVDASPDMLDVLRSKDPDGTVHAIEADMVQPGLPGEFDLVYIVANSLFELRTQEQQLACVTSAASLLRPDGNLVIEAALPHVLFADQRPLFVGQLNDLNSVNLQALKYDQVNQIIQYRHIVISGDGIKVLPSTHRLIHLPELDLMARFGGLELAARHSDWTGGPFTPAVGRHISVYRKASSSAAPRFPVSHP